MIQIPVENGLRFFAAISKDHLQDFIELVHVHMGPSAEPQVLITHNNQPTEGEYK